MDHGHMDHGGHNSMPGMDHGDMGNMCSMNVRIKTPVSFILARLIAAR